MWKLLCRKLYLHFIMRWWQKKQQKRSRWRKLIRRIKRAKKRNRWRVESLCRNRLQELPGVIIIMHTPPPGRQKKGSGRLVFLPVTFLFLPIWIIRDMEVWLHWIKNRRKIHLMLLWRQGMNWIIRRWNITCLSHSAHLSVLSWMRNGVSRRE